LGMPNPGIRYLQNYHNEFAILDKPVVVSIAGFNVKEYIALAVASVPWASAVEVNLGCPNIWTDQGQHRIASFDLKYMRQILDGVANVIGRNVDLRVKLSPYSDPFLLAEVASLIDMHEVDAIVASNTFPNGWLPDALDISYGGISGAAMKAIVLGQVRQFKSACGVPIIAAGGIRNGLDLMDCEAAGASGVQIGSRYLDRSEDPDVFVDILSQAADLGA
jgi:dihydroorotate dehydrogenase (fumarate)